MLDMGSDLDEQSRYGVAASVISSAQVLRAARGFSCIFWGLPLALLLLTGCGRIGPGNVTRDRFGYADAIAESWKKRMILNMVMTQSFST